MSSDSSSTSSKISTSETKHLMHPSLQPLLCLFAHCSHSLNLTLYPPSPTSTHTSIWPTWQAPFTIRISHLQLLPATVTNHPSLHETKGFAEIHNFSAETRRIPSKLGRVDYLTPLLIDRITLSHL